MYVCVWQSDTLKVCILLQPTHRPRPLSSHLALSADFTKMSLSSPVHIHGHVVVLTAVKTYSVNYFLILMTIFKLDNKTKLNQSYGSFIT